MNFAIPPWLASHLICELYHAIIFYYVLNLSTILVHSITLPVHQPFGMVMGNLEWKQGLQSRQCYLTKRMSCWLPIAPQRRIQRQMTSHIPPPPEVHALTWQGYVTRIVRMVSCIAMSFA